MVYTDRYRSVAQFTNDLRYIAESRLQREALKLSGHPTTTNKDLKERVVAMYKELTLFVDEMLEPNLTL